MKILSDLFNTDLYIIIGRLLLRKIKFRLLISPIYVGSLLKSCQPIFELYDHTRGRDFVNVKSLLLRGTGTSECPLFY